MTLACPSCGLSYAVMRTGYTFASIRREMYSYDPDRATWRNKRRRGVLGYWHERKRMLWQYHLSECNGGNDNGQG